MVLGYRDSGYPFHQFRNEMDRLLTGFFGPTAAAVLPAVFQSQPAANVWEQGDSLTVEMELPGIKGDQVDVSVVGTELTIKIQRPEIAQEGIAYHRRERPVGSFNRILRLPVEVDADHVQAGLRDGVLTVKLPKAESAKPRKINVAGV